jgi:flavin reductase (DIM6/NTAB) family NADH-FMN oxidoreductase RutF
VLDQEAYHRLIDATDPPALIVTAAAGGERAGCLVTFDSPCSVHPPRYAVWLSHQNRTFEVAKDAEVLAVHLLTDEDRGLAGLFGSVSGYEEDKFTRCSWREGPDGTVLLDIAGAWFTGRVIERLSTGDHTMFVLEPLAAGGKVERPIRFSDVKEFPPGRPT